MAAHLRFHLAESLPAGQFHLHFGLPPEVITAYVQTVAPAAQSTATATVFWQPITAVVDSMAPMALSHGHATIWNRLRREADCSFTVSARVHISQGAAWGLSASRRADRQSAWSLPFSAVGESRAAWSHFDRAQGRATGQWGLFDASTGPGRATWQRFLAPETPGRAIWTAPGPAVWKTGRAVNDWAAPLERPVGARWGLFIARRHANVARWDYAPLMLRAGLARWTRFLNRWWDGPVPVPKPVNPDPRPIPTGPFHLFFHRPGWPVPQGMNFRLHFGRRYSAPRYGVYMITDLGLFKLPNLEPIHFQNLSIDTAMDSHAALLRATIRDPAGYALLQPGSDLEPVEVRAVLNGYTWDWVITEIAGSKAFAEQTWTVNAQSPIIYLGSPFAPTRDYLETHTRSAHQLAEQELENLGFELVWDTVDWIVPARVWNYQNLTPLEAIKRLAGAAGAHVSAHATDHTIIISPRYPIEPWLWLNQVPVTTITASQARSLAIQNYRHDNTNRVVVSGGNVGKNRVIAVRSGTAGEISKDVFTDSLICHFDAGQERCRQDLSAAGRHCDVVLTSIPLPPAPDPPGLIHVGDLVAVDWQGDSFVGLVTGVKIDAQIGSLLQQITLDRFLET